MKNSKHLFQGLVQRWRVNRRRRTGLSATRTEPLETRVLPAIITVTSLADNLNNDGQVTLREAIQAADTDTSVNGSTAGNGADTIQFAAGLTGTMLLNGTQLEIASEVTIVGPSQNELILNGNNKTRIFQILNSGVVTIDGVTIRNGSDSEGGGIRNDGVLTINNSTIRSNVATLDGGGIDNFGTLTLNATTVNNNTSSGSGGGIYNWGTLNIDRSTIYANVATDDGGGIGNVGNLSIANTTVSFNSTESGDGAGIQTDSAMTLVNSTLIGNRASKDGTGAGTGAGTGGGIAALSTTAFVMHNTVVARNFSGANTALVSSDIATPSGTNVVDPVSSNNFIAVDSGFTGISNGTNGNQIGTVAAPLDPKLSGLILNAGHYSHSPLTGSPLINAGSDSVANDSFGSPGQFDQAGLSRKDDTVDIGSIEVNSDVNIRWIGGRHVVDVLGTAGTDVITLVVNSSVRIAINGVNYEFDADRLIDPDFTIDGLFGPDQFQADLSAADDEVSFAPLGVRVSSPDYNLFAKSFYFKTVDGAGGHDSVTFTDSVGNDTFVGRRDFASMSGSGVTSTATNFEEVRATAFNGGNDTAELSIENEQVTYVANPQDRVSSDTTIVTLDTDNTYYELRRFDKTETWLLGTVNSASRADFFDTTGNDVFVATPVAATFRGAFVTRSGVRITGVRRFEHTIYNSPVNRAYSSNGGADTAYLYDSAGDDLYVVKPEFALMRPAAGNSYYNQARDFDTYIGYASTGHDSVQFYDSVNKDTLVSSKNHLVLRTTGFYAQASGFDIRDVYSVRGGNDEAQLVGAFGNTHVVVQGHVATISDSDGDPTSTPSWKTTTSGFSNVVVIGVAGGVNRLDWIGSLNFALRRAGVWSIN